VAQPDGTVVMNRFLTLLALCLVLIVVFIAAT
jgi:hypothetical protein